MDEITINDIGTDFRVTISEDDAVINISTATGLAVIFKKPDGTTLEVAAALFTDGVDGILSYQTSAGVIDQTGTWSYRGKVTFSASLVFITIDPQLFEVVE